jgi:hypothetical protein
VKWTATVLAAQRYQELHRPAMQGSNSSVVELHHDFAAAISILRTHTLTCQFPESMHLFVVCASHTPERCQLDEVRRLFVARSHIVVVACGIFRSF